MKNNNSKQNKNKNHTLAEVQTAGLTQLLHRQTHPELTRDWRDTQEGIGS